ncbi:hypothetical protein PTTG_07608 [Puccinia triticina 1-1 BBBD Race 1]|uniref:Uncharacterized protein n=1 Tax=Puccinia triticina (isolate 1-1 / race 1 (BBBD)) TaxID=630390 RepID=A0A0C4F3C9_PUCT1|nr:hypothetical protein PTTG_07608 [Puccinia triticina 1-1 BBBD Race 1]
MISFNTRPLVHQWPRRLDKLITINHSRPIMSTLLAFQPDRQLPTAYTPYQTVILPKPLLKNLGEPQDLESLDYLLKLLRDGTPGPHSLAAVGVSQADSGVPQVLDRQVHTTAGAGPPDMPAVSEYKFPPSSVATSGPNQMVQPVVKTLKPQTLRGTRKRKERED